MHSFFDDHPSEYLVSSNTVLVGLCTGLLAAAAVSISQSVLDLISNALIIVRIAFRIGVKVNETARRLSALHDAQANQSWSRLVLGVQKEASMDEVAQFNERKVRFTGRVPVPSVKLRNILGTTTGESSLHELQQQRCSHH